MEVIDKQNDVIRFSVDLPYLTANEDVKLSEELTTSSVWRRDEDSSFVLVFGTFYKVSGDGCGQLIDYYSQLKVNCRFHVVEEDALEIVNMKRETLVKLHEFMQEKMGSNYSLLSYPTKVISHDFLLESEAAREVSSIKRIIESPKFEEMTAEQREIAKLAQPFAIILKQN